MVSFEVPADLTFNRGPIADPEAFARDVGAASWLFLCGEEFAAMDGGMSYTQVQAAVPESENIISDPPRVLDIDLARRHMAALDRLPRPTLVTFVHLATGWVLCRSRPTVTNLVCTIGSSLLGHLARHWTVYEKFFYRAAWSLPQVSRLLLTRVVVPLIDRCAVGSGGAIDLDIDDTTCGRCGRHATAGTR